MDNLVARVIQNILPVQWKYGHSVPTSKKRLGMQHAAPMRALRETDLGITAVIC